MFLERNFDDTVANQKALFIEGVSQIHTSSEMPVFYWKPAMEEALTNRQFINTVVGVVGDEKEPWFNRSALDGAVQGRWKSNIQWLVECIEPF